MAEFFRGTSTRQDKIQILRFEPHRNLTYGNSILERKWTMSMKRSKKTITNKSRQVETILDRRIVNLSNLQLTRSETNLLRKGLNFCPTPPPPRIEDINKDIDTFARRLTLREYHTPENIDEITDSPGYQPSILHQLNQKERNTQYRPSREPYLNTYVERLRQEITDETLHNQRFQLNNLSKHERAALDRLSNNREIIIKPADKGGATVILNSVDYVKEAKCQLDNEIYYNKIENDLTSEHEQLINQCIDTLKNNGELEEEKQNFLNQRNRELQYSICSLRYTKSTILGDQ